MRYQRQQSGIRNKRSSCPGIKESMSFDVTDRRGLSIEKSKRINLKLKSNKKCFETMVENNRKIVQERLAKVLAINNI
jgi:N-methylhydantoinase B/oxoprolinase/acetone carboxylase alpha subunit